jgi:hypothetical protein
MIDLIVWSRARPQQLDLLLRSVELYAKDIFNISVIYKIIGDHYDFKGYHKARDKFPHVQWIPETPNPKAFQGHTAFAIEWGKSDYVCFACDDNVVYRPVDKKLLEKYLPKAENTCFSLRLGYNCIVQDCHRGTVQMPLNIVVDNEEIIEWPISYYAPETNYGYPFSLDFHIYRKSLINKILPNIDFRNPSELEGNMTRWRSSIDFMRAFPQSCTVNIPANSAGGVTRAGEQHPASLDDLNEMYLDDWIIDLQDISTTKWMGAHQEHKLELVMEK